MNRSKKRVLWLAVAICLVMTACISGALAYFTTNVEATGGRTIRLQNVTTVDEEYGDWVKHVTVRAQPGSQPLYVRARAYAASAFPLAYSGDGWTLEEDGYCYFAAPLANLGQDENGDPLPLPDGCLAATTVLDVAISGVAPDAVDPEAFEVTVVYETTPAQYDSAGAPYADWTLATILQGGDNA